MAKPQHLAILEQGVTAWNDWRAAHPRIRPDLSTAALQSAALRGVNFARTNLTNADIRGADLRGADLAGAVLYNVDGRGAMLEGADLAEADLQRGLFMGARLRGARLELADLRRASFEDADLRACNIAGADLADALLHRARLAGASFDDASLDSTDLAECDLRRCSFIGTSMVNVRMANAWLDGVQLAGRNLSGGIFWRARLDRADLRDAICQQVDFSESTLQRADLRGTRFIDTSLANADLRGANLEGALLENCSLLQARVDGASFRGCCIYGVSAWDLQGTPKLQKDLVITPADEPDITVDDIEVAQFVYLVYSNRKIRNFLNAFTDKNVLILGRFALPERKAVLDGLRERLRRHNLVPIVFDFDAPQDKDYTETVQTLAGMSMFVVVDVTNPKSTPLEMEATVKQFKIPYLPIIDTSVDSRPFAMMVDLQKSFHWVLPTFGYHGAAELFDNLDAAIVQRARAKHQELREHKARAAMPMLTAADLQRSRAAPRPASRPKPGRG